MNNPEIFVVRIYRRYPGGLTGVVESAADGLTTPFNGTAELLRCLAWLAGGTGNGDNPDIGQ